MTRTLTALAVTTLLYGAWSLGANPVLAAGLDAETKAEIATLSEEHLHSKLVVHDAPKTPSGETFVDGAGDTVSFADFQGQVVLVNFWATWCPPCRAEMPSIDRLAGAMEGEDFHVIALSLDRGTKGRIEKFFDEIAVEHLALYHDRPSNVARTSAILGLPVTIILDRDGMEVARLTGDAEWDGDGVKQIMASIIEATKTEEHAATTE